MKALTKAQWEGLRETLLRVPARSRNIAWKDAFDLVEYILKSGRLNITPEVDLSTGCFAAVCSICNDKISVEDDFVRHALSNRFVHYDCHHRSSQPLGGLAS